MQEERSELLKQTRDVGDWPDPTKWTKMQLDESKYESELPDIDPQVEADLEEIAKRNAEIVCCLVWLPNGLRWIY